MDATLYVGNLSKSTTEAELKTLFTQMGDVTDLKIEKGRDDGRSRGFGYLTMSAQSEADKAVSRLNDYSFQGSKLQVRLAKPRVVSGAPGPLFEP